MTITRIIIHICTHTCIPHATIFQIRTHVLNKLFPLIHYRCCIIYIYPSPTVYSKMYASTLEHIQMYTQTPTLIQIYANLYNHRKCIQMHPNIANIPKHIKTNPNTRKYSRAQIIPYTGTYTQIHQHMSGHKYAPTHPNPIFKHTPRPDKSIGGHRNMDKS